MKTSINRARHSRPISVRLMALTLCLAPLGGCAVLNDSNDAFAQGWRRAKVVSLGMSSNARFECQGEADAPMVTGQRAIASYSVAGSPNVRNLRAVAVPEDAKLNVGDQILVNVRSCQLSLRKLVADPKG